MVGSCTEGSGADTITLSGNVPLSAALPSISSTITIDGTSSKYTIDGMGSYQIFYVASSGNLTVNRLTLTRGTAIDGGAITTDGVLTISNSQFTGNSATYYGGAVLVGQHNITAEISNSSFQNNSAGINGGGLENRGRLSITGSYFGDNTAPTGGAINNTSRGNEGVGTLTVSNSTFYRNTSSIANGPHGAGPNGGNASLTLVHITVDSLSGYGLYNEDTLNLYNSIIVDDCQGSLSANQNNLIQNGSCSPALSGDPRLGSLTGSPAYFPLLPGSPAIDAGVSSRCPSRDQRGAQRPQGAGCDIGAYEYGGSARTSRSRSEPEPEPEPVVDHAEVGRENRRELLEGTGIEVTSSQDQVFGNHLVNERGQPDYDAVSHPELLRVGFIDAVDIFGWIDEWNTTEICFPETGFLMILDARTSPRALRALDTYYKDGMTCATLTFPGTVVLLPNADITREFWEIWGGKLIQTQTQTVQPVQPVQSPTIITQMPQADGSIEHIVRPEETLWSIAAAYGLELADLYTLNPGLGDGRLLRVGRVLVIRRPLPPDTIPVSSQETIENLPRLESETVDILAVENILKLGELYGVIESVCSAAIGIPKASVGTAVQEGIETASNEVIAATDVATEYLNSDLTPEQAEVFVKLKLADAALGANPCSVLGIAIRQLQDGQEGLPLMDQFYRPLYLAHGVGFYGDEAEKLLHPVPSCVMKAEQSVAARAWPEAKRLEVGRIRAGDNLLVYGKIKLPGQGTFYITRGQLVTSEGIAGLGKQTRSGGQMFVAASHVDVVGKCDEVIDLSPIGHLLEPPPPLQESTNMIINLPDETCGFLVHQHQSFRLCPEVWAEEDDCLLRENAFTPTCDYDIKKISDDGWLYVEPSPVDAGYCEYTGWIPPLRNQARSTQQQVRKIIFGKTDYPEVLECLLGYFDE